MIIQRLFSHTWENIKDAGERTKKAKELLEWREAANKSLDRQLHDIDVDELTEIREVASGKGSKSGKYAVVDKDGNIKLGKDGKPIIKTIEGGERKSVDDIKRISGSKRSEAIKARNAEFDYIQDKKHRTEMAKRKESERLAKESVSGKLHSVKEKTKIAARKATKKAEDAIKNLPKGVKVGTAVTLGTATVGTAAGLTAKKIHDKKVREENYRSAVEASEKVNKRK